MKRFASVLSPLAVIPLFWATVNAGGALLCPRDAGGHLQTYSVVRPDRQGVAQTLVFDGVPQGSFCKLVKNFPSA